MTIHDLNSKSICVLGYGREGQSVVRALEAYAPDASIVIADENDELRITKYEKQIGTDYLHDLDRFDVVIKSPGIPPHVLPSVRNALLTNATQIFLDTVKEKGSLVVGVTGSKGKSTTASLIAKILRDAGKDAHLVGNIGIPALDFLKDAKKETIFVQEMSSYQLMQLTISPAVAVVTTFFPEHLDYHGSLAAYKEAKTHIAKFQSEDDIVFYDASSPEAKDIADHSPGKRIPFSEKDAPLKIEETKLIGKHNLRNIAAAFKVASHFEVPKNTAIQAIRSFEGLHHRLQTLGEHHGIRWVDDAISTTPESAIAALDALGNDVSTIILGGQDRGNDFMELGKRIAASKIEHVILMGESGARIRKAIEDAEAPVTFHEASSLEDVVAYGKKHTKKGKICLLSTASPSYDMFKNFEEKGEQFAKLITGKP